VIRGGSVGFAVTERGVALAFVPTDGGASSPFVPDFAWLLALEVVAQGLKGRVAATKPICFGTG
jgi:hypothetical protein